MVETFYELEELLAAIAAVRELLASDRCAPHLRRGRDDARRRVRGARCGDPGRPRRGRDRREPRRRPAGVAARNRANARRRQAARGHAERRPREPRRPPRRLVFPHTTPEYFADFAAHAQELGARIVGGCCGTTPTEVAAIRAAVDERRRPRAPLVARERELVVAAPEPEYETLLQRKLGAGEFVVSVEIDPPRGGNAHSMLELARELQASGHVDVVDVNDNPRARARMSGIMASATIERVVGIETIPHLTPRDSSIAGLESTLLGAHAEGIRNVLSVTGDPPEAGDYPGATGVYEVDSIGLSQVITRMNAGEDFNGREIDAPTSFYLGVAVNPAADDLDYELERFERKLEAGAKFAMTQVLFDFSFLDTFLERLGRASPIPLLIGIFYVRSYQLALRLHNEVPGIVVPEHVQARLRDAGSDAGDVGLSIAKELLEESRERAEGVYIIPPFRQPRAALDLFG